DFNGDGLLDIASCGGSSDLHIRFGAGDATFAPPNSFIVGNTPGAIAAGDLDNDGDIDIAVGNFTNVSIALNDGAGSFAIQPVLPAGTFITFLTLGDINGDGALDL